jgi:hypothetical protein
MVLQKIIVDDDDPGVLIDWDTDALERFVVFANARGGVPVQPPWITTAPGGMSIATLTRDIITHAAAAGGGRTGRVLIAPNTQVQSWNVFGRFLRIEMDPFVQGCLPAAQKPLATISAICDRKIAAAVPAAIVPPPAGMLRAFL